MNSRTSRRLGLVALITASMMTGCASSTADSLGSRYLDGRFAFDPGWGTAAGRHEYDGRGPDLSASALARRRDELRALRSEIDTFITAHPRGEASMRVRSLGAAVDGDLFQLDIMRLYTRNPMAYAGAVDVSIYGKRDFAPKPSRARSAAKVLECVPTIVAAAKANLDQNLPEVYIRTAILIAQGQVDFYKGDLLAAFADMTDAELKQQLAAAANTAASAMEGYITFLRDERLPHATMDFSIGRDNFARMLREQELIEQSPEEILSIGLAELSRQQQSFMSAAREVDPNRPPLEVWTDVQKEFPPADRLLDETRKHLEEIRAFFADRDLIRYPTGERVIVDETPAFLRATSFASMDTPGAFERRATESFYYVTLPDRSWDAARTDEWLTAFNYYTTDVVSIHEAYPGHFVQAQHLHDSDAHGATRYVGSYAFIEGWAHYCEEMAIEEGFPPPSLAQDPKAAAKYRMAQASEALLRVCRLVAAIRMHCQGMSLDDATKFFSENCYYPEAPARSEAERGSYDPAYCLYTVGKLQLLTLRDDWRRQEGPRFSLKRFHDEVLRHGQPPVRLLRERMLLDARSWDRTMAGTGSVRVMR